MHASALCYSKEHIFNYNEYYFRVSFGSTHGSMVETLIIDDMPAEERNFYQQNLINATNNSFSINTNGAIKRTE